MKLTTALLLTMAALVSATPNPNGIQPGLLSVRQDCVYNCECNDDKEGPDPDPDTARCCSSVGGTLGNEGTLCIDMLQAKAQDYARCCGRSGGFTCFQDPASETSCPPITV